MTSTDKFVNLSTLYYWVGLWRIWWGWCPVCNSDAPNIDKCQWCAGQRGWKPKMIRKQWAMRWRHERKVNGCIW
jgi:hypothetical protein